MRLEQIGMRYGRRATPVLRDVTLSFSSARVSAILGRNGSGKSTLLRIVAGVLSPTSGRVEDRPRVVGYVPERFPSRLRMPALAYLCHVGRIRGMSTAAARARGTHLLERLELAGGQDTPVAELSKGNAQKVALAQAFLVPAGLLVLDEPWSGLDPSVHGILISLVEQAREDGAVVVLTEHRPAVVDQVATDVYHLVNGTLLARDPAASPVAVGPARPGASGALGGHTSPLDQIDQLDQSDQHDQTDQRDPLDRLDAVGQVGRVGRVGRAAPVASVPSATSAVPAEPTSVAVELRLPAGYSGAPTGLPGVVEWRRDGDVLHLLVESGRSDLLLAEALRQGCSVLRLVPRR